MIANREEMMGAEQGGGGRSAPGERDLQIYAAVRVDGRRQADVAAEFGITQGRVSQIVRHVQRWRVAMTPAAEMQRRDQQSVQRWLDDQRLEKLYEEAMELYRQSCQPRRKERRGRNADGEWSTEAIDHGPGNVQCLKLAARLIEMRREGEQTPQPSVASIEQTDEHMLFDRLCDLRVRAEMRRDVPPSETCPGNLVERLLGDLLGWRRHAPLAEKEFDFAAREAEAEAEVGQDSSCQVASVGQDLSCRVAERQDKSCPTNANTPAIINNISAAELSEASEPVEPTACAAVLCDAEPAPMPEAAGANNSEIFSENADSGHTPSRGSLRDPQPPVADHGGWTPTEGGTGVLASVLTGEPNSPAK